MFQRAYEGVLSASLKLSKTPADLFVFASFLAPTYKAANALAASFSEHCECPVVSIYMHNSGAYVVIAYHYQNFAELKNG